MRSALPETHVVVTCSNRKRRPVPPALTVRSLPDLSPAERTKEWICRLESTAIPLDAALDLYAGEHWSIVRRLPPVTASGQSPVTLWILSAGYGLIPAKAKVRPYAATFSSGHPDCVGSNGERRRWWRTLTQWPGPKPGAPRSVEALARRDPNAAIVMAVSPPYLDACADDVAAAAAAVQRPEKLSVICTGASSDAMPGHMLPGDARLQHVLGGTRQALNVRVLEHLLCNHRGPLTSDAAAETLSRLLERQPPLVQHDRRRCSDAEVTRFIRARLGQDPSLSRSRLLRQLRDEGRACEQSRFAALFGAVRAAS